MFVCYSKWLWGKQVFSPSLCVGRSHHQCVKATEMLVQPCRPLESLPKPWPVETQSILPQISACSLSPDSSFHTYSCLWLSQNPLPRGARNVPKLGDLQGNFWEGTGWRGSSQNTKVKMQMTSQRTVSVTVLKVFPSAEPRWPSLTKPQPLPLFLPLSTLLFSSLFSTSLSSSSPEGGKPQNVFTPCPPQRTFPFPLLFCHCWQLTSGSHLPQSVRSFPTDRYFRLRRDLFTFLH